MQNETAMYSKANAEVLKGVENVDVKTLETITESITIVEKIVEDGLQESPGILLLIADFLTAARPVFIEGDRLRHLNVHVPELITINECDKPGDIVIAGAVRKLLDDDDSELTYEEQEAVKALAVDQGAVLPEAVTVSSLNDIVEGNVRIGISRQLFSLHHSSDFGSEIAEKLQPIVKKTAEEETAYATTVSDKINSTIAYWTSAIQELDALVSELDNQNTHLLGYKELAEFLTDYNRKGKDNGGLNDDIRRIIDQGDDYITKKYSEVIDSIEQNMSMDSILVSASELLGYLEKLENTDKFPWFAHIRDRLSSSDVTYMRDEQAERTRLKSLIDNQLSILAELPEGERNFLISMSESKDDEVADLLSAELTESRESTDIDEYVTKVRALSSSLAACEDTARTLKANLDDALDGDTEDALLLTVKRDVEQWSEYIYSATLARLPDEYDQWQIAVADVATKAQAATTGENGAAVIEAAKQLQEAYALLSKETSAVI
jgi:hypothetical protein